MPAPGSVSAKRVAAERSNEDVSKRPKKEEPPPAPAESPQHADVPEFYALEDRLAREKTLEEMEREFLAESSQVRAALEALVKGEEPKTDNISLLLNAVTMRRLGRLAQYATHQMRDETAERLTAVETRHLQLQNVRSEVQHLKREIDRCLEFKSADEDLVLVSEEEFYEKAPASISRPEETKDDEHQRRLARLNWEVTERKNLMGTLAELEGRRNVLASDIRGKEQRLNSFKPKLEALIQASKPLQELVGVSSKDEDDEEEGQEEGTEEGEEDRVSERTALDDDDDSESTKSSRHRRMKSEKSEEKLAVAPSTQQEPMETDESSSQNVKDEPMDS